jgi:hypothetical protein
MPGEARQASFTLERNTEPDTQYEVIVCTLAVPGAEHLGFGDTLAEAAADALTTWARG